jgi:hypothetical protein
MTSSALNRRSFLARSAAIAAVPAVATLTGGVLVEPASADSLPDYAPIPPSALGPAVNAQGYHVGRVERNLYWVTDGTYHVHPRAYRGAITGLSEGGVGSAPWLPSAGDRGVGRGLGGSTTPPLTPVPSSSR